MKAIQLARPSPDAFHAVELDDPVPAASQMLVRMKAASLNFIDVALATGAYPGASYPIIPLADGAGEVIAVGSAVAGLSAGDRVAIHSKCGWPASDEKLQRARALGADHLINYRATPRRDAVSARSRAATAPTSCWRPRARRPSASRSTPLGMAARCSPSVS